MKFLARTALAVVVSALAAAALPLTSLGATPATPVPITKPDFSTMKFMLGTWTCHQTVRGLDRPDTSTTTIGMDGQWMVSQDTAPPFDKYRTAAVKGVTYIGYDPNVKKWVSVNVDNFGGYFLSTSPGWSGKTIVWTSKALDGTTTTVTTTKISDTQTKDAFANTDAEGKVLRASDTCSKH